MPAESPGINRTKIQTLQFVMSKVSTAEAEEPLCEVPIVFYSTHDFIRGDSAILASIGRLNRGLIDGQLVFERLAIRRDSSIQIGSIAISARKGEAQSHSTFPPFNQRRVQALFVHRLLICRTDNDDLCERHLNLARAGGMDYQVRAVGGDRAVHGFVARGHYVQRFI